MIQVCNLRMLAVSLLLTACQPNKTITPVPELDHSGLIPLDVHYAEPTEYRSGGAATVFVANEDAFSRRPAAIAKNFRLDGAFTSGDHLFRTPLQGIGPLLNTSTCQGCHLNDGRGVVPQSTNEPFTSMLVKVGDSKGAPDPIYGDQIQTFSLHSFISSDFLSGLPKQDSAKKGELRGEAFAYIEYQEVKGKFSDGQPYQLRRPVYKFKDLSFGDFVEDIQFSARVAPQVFGVGLLDAIPDAHLLALADPNDEDNNGISGRVSWVTDALDSSQRIGRFAYKAQTPSVLQQVAAAFRGDSGITSSIFPQENCTGQQAVCLTAADQEVSKGEQPDIDDIVLAFVEFYNRTLAVPARRGFDKASQTWQTDIELGRTQFMQIGCANCHTPRHVTGLAKGSVLGQAGLTGLTPNAPPIEVLSNQTIYPYTDLLLHDMGGQCQITRETASNESCSESDTCLYVQRCTGLADGLTQGDASGREWKTPPLWGLGLVQTVNQASTFLHDGRARSIEEAVLWHGGEAKQSQQAYINLPAEQRAQMLAFLYSL